MAKKINEFKDPARAINYDKIPNSEGFWQWSVKDASDKTNMVPINAPFKVVSDVILWLNKAAIAWDSMQTKKESVGENKMDIRESIRKMVRKQLKEELKKYKAANMPFVKAGKETPKATIDRDMTKEDSVELNKQAEKDTKDAKTAKNSGVPTDKEWKRFRTAEEVELPPTSEEVNAAREKLLEKLEKDIESMCEIAETFDDKTLCGLMDDLKLTAQKMGAIGDRFIRRRFTELQDCFKPIYKHLVSLSQFAENKSHENDIDKLMEMCKKYIKLEVKKKHDTQTEKTEDEVKEAAKQLKK